MLMRKTLPPAIVWMAGCFLLIGCGDGKPPTYPVKGEVRSLDGKPLVGAQVLFHPVNPPPGPVYNTIGVVDDNGKLVVSTHTSGDGAPVGEYILTVTWPTVRKTMMDPDKDRLEGRYADKAKSTFKCIIEKKAMNELPPIAVK